MPTPRPAWWAGHAAGFAALAIPPGGRRSRYQQEFLSELYGMDHAQQLRHIIGLLAQAWALRSALAQTPEDDVVTINWFRRLCCKFNLRHAWEIRYTEDNELFHECAHCGRSFYRGPTTGLGMGSGFFG